MKSEFDSKSDSLLVEKIREDNEDAFRSLFNRYSRKIYYFSLRFLCSKEDAEELVQSVFINIWEQRRTLDETLSVKSYIFRSAVNYIANYLKRKALHIKFNQSEINKGAIHSNSTYEQVFLHDLEDAIDSFVETLPAQQQKIFRLSRYEGLSYKDIADKLDLSVRTVENQMYRVLKMLRTMLKEGYF